MVTLSDEQKKRYSRHLMLSEIGESGQKKLLEARVLVVGLGGLGSAISYYLAAAGIGCLGLLDSDIVDISNLQRQILHSTSTIGVKKTDSARKTISALNPDVKLITYSQRLTSENAVDVIKNYDVIVDGCDNQHTRYIMNEACMASGKPYVHGSIFQFEGMATVFLPDRGPCYRCLYPKPTPDDMLPGPNEIGLLGILPGVIGTIEATETIKLILDIGESLNGRLLIYDALNMEFQKIEIKRHSDCLICKDKTPEHDIESTEDHQNQSILDMLIEKGISIDELVKTGLEMYIPDPKIGSKEDMRLLLREGILSALKDINVCSLILAGLRLEEEGKNGLIPGLSSKEYESDPVHLIADEILGIQIATYIGGTRALFEFERFDRKKPGILANLTPILDDVIGGLISGCLVKTCSL